MLWDTIVYFVLYNVWDVLPLIIVMNYHTVCFPKPSTRIETTSTTPIETATPDTSYIQSTDQESQHESS